MDEDYILIQISLKFLPMGPIDNIAPLLEPCNGHQDLWRHMVSLYLRELSLLTLFKLINYWKSRQLLCAFLWVKRIVKYREQMELTFHHTDHDIWNTFELYFEIL